jgi:peptidoglycan/LPS O-acetylase OafA/YrhL
MNNRDNGLAETMDGPQYPRTPPQNHPRLRTNNFDLLRVVLAGTVLLYHAAGASGFAELAFFEKILSADTAVKAFFVVSGFLIFMSYERSSSLASYTGKRLKRIYPAYFTVVVLSAFLLALVSALDLAAYFFSLEWWRYLIYNLSFLNFLQPTLPGVFETNVEPFVNASLWTLKIEVMFYIAVPILVYLMRKFSQNTVLVFFYFAGLTYATLCNYAAVALDMAIFEELGRQLPGQLHYFMAGAFFYYNLALFERHVRHFVAGAVLVLLLDQLLPLGLLEPFALATVVIFAALFGYLGHFGKYGDFSYGIYILHFPIAQTLAASGAFVGMPWLYMGSVIVLSGASAVLMWHLIEKKFLGRTAKSAPPVAVAQPASG